MTNSPKITARALPGGLLGQSVENADLVKLGGMLGGLLAPEPLSFEEKWFNKKTVELDGYRFVRCRFDSCQFVIRTGNIALEQCSLNDCTFVFEGPAGVIAQMDELARRMSLQAQALKAQYHADGTVSVP